ncbi:PAS domain S-box protein [Hymenobacter aerilatus]|uniref:histidine kinase n=1 Tax=Hymenobacter aerilatus TaxID=2932251 RepID=A0A8T9STV3_9BACT|nr:ATP-binding protein [Hymenobacter aerilatus]UOR05265.1 PAS domain S-box protein [Hymenobacter aerilatus]
MISPGSLPGTEHQILSLQIRQQELEAQNAALRAQLAQLTTQRPPGLLLHSGEDRYQLLFNSIDSGFCVVEMLFDAEQRPIDYRFLEANLAFERQTGLHDAVNKTMRELHPAHEDHWFEIYGRVALTGEPIRFEQRAEQLGRWYDVYAFRVGAPQQQQVAILFNDISFRKQIEERLHQREEQQAFLLQLSDRLRPLADPSDVQYQAACALGEYLEADRVGYAEDQHDGETIVVTRNYTNGVPSIEGRYHYDDYGPELLREFRAGRKVVRHDIANDPTLTASEKEAHAVLQLGATVNVPLLKNGRLVAVLFMHYRQAHHWSERELELLAEVAERTWDAVVRTRTEAALRQSEERLQKAISIETVGVIFFNLDGRITDANEAFQRMSGYSQVDFASGRVRWDELTLPEFMDSTFQLQEELLKQGESTPYEKQYIRPDGTRWWGRFAGKRLSEQEYVGFVLDITSSKLAQQQLHTSNEQLQRINIDLDNFIYAASHDLKAPITNIEGLVYALQDQLATEGELASATTPLLLMMQDAIARFQRTLDYLSDVVKLQKEHDRPVEQVAVAAIVEDVRLDLQPLIEQTGAQVEQELSECITVDFSPKNLRSVVYNLLSNALKYCVPGRTPHVRIRCYQQPEYTVLAVQDNGLGLNEHQQTELFTMFRRFHVGIEGSGIGLYIVKRVVENMGGKLTVESAPGVGSTFSVYFRR